MSLTLCFFYEVRAGARRAGRERASGEQVARWSDPMAGRPAGAAGGRFPVPVQQQGGKPPAPARTGVDTPSGGGTSPGTAAFGSWRAAGAGSGLQVSRCPGGLIPWPEASRDNRRAVPGTRATAGAGSPGPDWGRYPQCWRIITRNSDVRKLAGSREPGAAFR